MPTLAITTYDVRGINVGGIDQLTITLPYSGDSGDSTPDVSFVDPKTGEIVHLNPASFRVNPNNTITLVINGNSLPTLVSLTGTVFTIAVPIDAEFTPPVDVGFLLSEEERGTGARGEPQCIARGRRLGGRHSGRIVERRFGAIGSRANVQGFNSGVDAAPESVGGGDDGPLSDLPPPPRPRITPPSASVVPVGAQEFIPSLDILTTSDQPADGLPAKGQSGDGGESRHLLQRETPPSVWTEERPIGARQENEWGEAIRFRLLERAAPRQEETEQASDDVFARLAEETHARSKALLLAATLVFADRVDYRRVFAGRNADLSSGIVQRRAKNRWAKRRLPRSFR